MAQQIINIGAVANDHTGDTLRDGGDKINDNFTELYTGLTGLLDFKGSTDCSANPNYPAASKGDYYLVSVAGKIGGASGVVVSVGDSYFATADNAGGTQASVGTSWTVVEGNLGFAPVNKAGDTMTGDLIVPDEAYDATAWNGSLEVPTKNAIRDKLETFGAFTAASTTEVLTGTDSAKGATADSIAALWEQGSDVASSGTISIGEGGYFNITGTTGITDIDFGTDKAGRKAWVKFAGALTLTHNASTLILPTGANVITAAGDTACFVSEGSDVVRCVAYNRASGAALTSSGSGLAAGTSFPGSPATSDLYYRTDRNILYFYDGTRWLSTNLYTLPITTNTQDLPFTATNAAFNRNANPHAGAYDIYIIDVILSYILVGAGSWAVTTSDSIGALATNSGLTATSQTVVTTSVNSVRSNSTCKLIYYTVTRTSGTDFYPTVAITYRLVG